MKNLLISIVLIFSFLLISCQKEKGGIVSPGLDEKGKVYLRFYKTTIPSEVKTIVAILSRVYPPEIISDSISVNNNLSDTLLITMNNIPAGNWLLRVFAKDSLSMVRYRGEIMVTIFPGQVTDAYVVMYPTGEGGVGSINIYVIWNIHQGNWRMSNNNPIIKQSPGSWDGSHPYIKAPSVLKDENDYKMWYISGDNTVQQIAYATSSDGVNWTKHDIVISQGGLGSIVEYGSDGCCVIKEGNIYKMWLNSKSYSVKHNGIAYATSTDGINWNIHPTQVIPTTSAKPLVFGPSVVKKDGIYYMYYSVMQSFDTLPIIYLATSTDGINWTDHRVVLQARNNIGWEKGGVFCPSVIYRNNKFVMYYTAKRSPDYFDIGFIGKAESNDGINWAFSSTEPELSNMHTYPWLTTLVAYPYVFEDNGKLKMYFSGISVYNNMYQIGLAEER